MKNETEFKQGLINDVNPDWYVELTPENKDAAISGMDVKLYLIDAASGWIGAGAMDVANFQKVRNWVHSRGIERFTGAGSASVKGIPTADTPGDSAATRNAIHTLAHYFAATKTYEAVMRTTSTTKGHWICVVYTLNDGSRLSRPLFAGADAPGRFMPMERLNGLLKAFIATDLSSPESSAGSQILAGGGTQIHESLQVAPESDRPPAPRG